MPGGIVESNCRRIVFAVAFVLEVNFLHSRQITQLLPRLGHQAGPNETVTLRGFAGVEDLANGGLPRHTGAANGEQAGNFLEGVHLVR